MGDFGLSDDEQAQLSGAATAGYLWDAVEELHGGAGAFRQDFVSEAWAKAHAEWQGCRVDADEDDYPVFTYDAGAGWTARYPVGGPYVTMQRDGADLEALHMQDEDRTPEGVVARVVAWVAECRADYT